MWLFRLSVVAVLVAALFVYPASAVASAERGSWNNWHVHDGGSGTDPSGLRHAGLGFFPEIFGSTYATTASLWAYCTDATDKGLVGGDGGAKAAAGHCMNDSSIIHLQAIPTGDPAPNGWTSLTPGAFFPGYTVYYRLTPR